MEPRLSPPGDRALLPHREGHRLGSRPGAPVAGLPTSLREPISEPYELTRRGGGGGQPRGGGQRLWAALGAAVPRLNPVAKLRVAFGYWLRNGGRDRDLDLDFGQHAIDWLGRYVFIVPNPPPNFEPGRFPGCLERGFDGLPLGDDPEDLNVGDVTGRVTFR